MYLKNFDDRKKQIVNSLKTLLKLEDKGLIKEWKMNDWLCTYYTRLGGKNGEDILLEMKVCDLTEEAVIKQVCNLRTKYMQQMQGLINDGILEDWEIKEIEKIFENYKNVDNLENAEKFEEWFKN
ncbi:hypothetical protein IX317_002133 [Fusobacterium sp. DD29]|uniref:hypothetical protein n=1 Tax=unclassified Fusobacterium TaxID=2648384 RepID=UPI001B8BAECA|nr:MULTISPECIES: hypothetical protein [unclassified Fusobacterium]MBR8750411.1 hypothetical protein [Fusobacterium sp. DD29]MBR8762652.1 hypothetical protein [Fusobacterium sp. DD25]MBR8768691.1 hypothetical protein [Fusobacterium sp. DD43]MBR8772764.1 hypothetical protein [Fusobacterium sp. DD40]MBR8776973.1 hypothetical protein [Fusobacterium sp. DD17]